MKVVLGSNVLVSALIKSVGSILKQLTVFELFSRQRPSYLSY
jgi:predicted nucleic acid-binding protein